MNTQIKLLLVNTVKTTQNGQTMFLLNYLRHMDLSDMQVGFAAANSVENWVRDELKSMGVRLYELPFRNRKPMKYVRALAKLMREGGYNVVHAHGNSATLASEMLAAKLAGVPVRIVHSHNTRCNHALLHRMLSPLMLKCANVRFACGKEAGEWLFGKRSFEIIRNASDAKMYGFDAKKRERMRKKLSLEERIVIGTVGSLNEQKNPLFLLDCFAEARKKNDKLHLLHVGDGGLRPQVEEKIGQLGLRDHVTLCGRRNDVPDLLQAMDLMVLPSVYEGFPCVLVEWQLNGLPALVSDAVTRDCDMTGLLRYLPLEMTVWADAMAGAQAADRTKISEASAEKVAHAGYDIAAEADRLKKRYAELLKEAKA